MNDKIQKLIVEIASETNCHLENKIPVELGTAAPLYGGNEGVLDSLSLVSLIVSVEQAIEDSFDVSISLASERAMSEKNSPFKSIGSLAQYAETLIREVS